MGSTLLNYFKEARDLAGLEGQIKLALITKISSSQAKTLLDSPDIIQQFEKAISIIKDSAA